MKSPLFCRHGHRWDDANTRWFTDKRGRRYRQCRICHLIHANLRYRNDPAFRARRSALGKARYRRLKAQQLEAQP